MLQEIDDALDHVQPNIILTPVGVGSLATAVTTHYSKEGTHTAVVAVEPDTAACLWRALEAGEVVPLETTYTIMQGG